MKEAVYMETSMPTQVQPEAPPHESPLRDRDTPTLDQQEEAEQDHEGEEEMRRRLDAWRCLAANLTGGFTQMPDAVRTDRRLGTSAKVVYEHLLGYMWQKEWCWPGQKRMAAELGISRRTIIRACQELYERGYIDKWRRGQGLTNFYFVNPLSFVATTTGRSLTTMSLRLPGDRVLVPGAALADLYSTTFYANDAALFSVPPKECQSGTSRSDTMAQLNVPKSHSKYTKANLDSSKQERNTDSSGVAAGFEKEEGGVKAIRNVGPLAFPLPTTSSPLSPRISKSLSLETGGGMHVEAAKVSGTEEKLSKWQALALAHGVSLTQQDALESYIKNCPRPMHIPMRVEESIDSLSRKFNNVQYLASNRTQATKLWQYARLRGMDHEYLHDTFQVWVDAAAAVSVPSFIQNKMAWFFKALHLEVLKALLPYESYTSVAPVAEEHLTVSETNETSSQEQEEQREGEQETSTHDAEALPQEHDVSPTPMNDEQGGGQEQRECEGEQETSTHDVAPTPPSAEQEFQQQQEPEYLMTDDPDAGWATWASAAHYAERLCGWVAMTTPHSVEVLPTRFGRYGFYLYEVSTPHLVLEYVTTGEVAARIEQEKEKQRLSSRRSLR